MVDMLPFPRVMGDTPEKQIAELVNYLIHFKETLEFALMNISTENLSQDLITTLNDLGANIEQSNLDREDEITQMSNNALTISDVCNSDVFKMAVNDEIKDYVTFNVNYETGHLEYNTSK